MLNEFKTRLAPDCPWIKQGINYYEDVPWYRINYTRCTKQEYNDHIKLVTKLSWSWVNSKIFVKKIKLARMLQDDRDLSQS